MNTVIENITPAKAREYFNTSIGEGKKPRPVSKDYVKSYADTMKKGRWMLNGVPIIFDTEGNLIDGCHRMLAVEMAGVPVQFSVVRGISSEAFTTYDCGRHRTVGQLLAMQGVKNYNLVGSIVVANERLIKNGRLFENNNAKEGNGNLRKTNLDRYENYCRDPEGFIKVASIVNTMKSRCNMLLPSWAGGLYYYLTHTGGYYEQEVFPFFDSLYSLDTTGIVPVNLLRKKITETYMSGKKLKTAVLFAIIVKAWNAYITGQDIKVLRYNPDSEKEYPKLILK